MEWVDLARGSGDKCIPIKPERDFDPATRRVCSVIMSVYFNDVPSECGMDEDEMHPGAFESGVGCMARACVVRPSPHASSCADAYPILRGKKRVPDVGDVIGVCIDVCADDCWWVAVHSVFFSNHGEEV